MKYLLLLAFIISAPAQAKNITTKNRKPASLDLSCQGALLDYYPCISSSISRKQAEVQGKAAHENEAAALTRLENAFNDLKSKKRLPEEAAQTLNSFCQMMLNVDDFVSAQ